MVGKSGMLGRVYKVGTRLLASMHFGASQSIGRWGSTQKDTWTNLTKDDCDSVKEVPPARLKEMLGNSGMQGRLRLQPPSVAVCVSARNNP